MMQRLSVETAGRLLDFTGGGAGPVGVAAAEEQLRGAVAIHNILAEHDVAYLADEVGMGKTYVALGAMALLRHFNPAARVLVIAPRENIQKKWLKELRNFVFSNVRFPDLRVKAVHGAPARSTVFCANVAALVHEVILDQDRDFFTRMTSFSLSVGKDGEAWKKSRDELLRYLPAVDRSLFDLRDKERFKENVGRALNAALPEFDLVIVDEGHNLKHGLGADASTRNRMLSLAFGHPDGADSAWPDYSPRARRVLFLSATPLEDDSRHLWNQLDVFGKGQRFRALVEKGDEAARHDCARRFLVRRVSSIRCGEAELTKNLYRREWRSGGVSAHDEPLEVKDARQQLVVALVQKKVAELIGSERFNNNFQIGMLASFESFLQTAGVAQDDEEGVFDDADQALDEAERRGLDVRAVNAMAADYRKRFHEELPHPKMDAMVDRLATAFENGEKTLVFVRRVASVEELRRKLNDRYDQHILACIRAGLDAELRPAFDAVGTRYREIRSARYQPAVRAANTNPADADAVLPDPGSSDSFFAWYFRGQTPLPGVLSGGQFALRFNSAGATLGTFFEDNHVAALLQVPCGRVTEALARAVSMDEAALRTRLRDDAGLRLSAARKHPRGTVFLAYQAAALALLSRVDEPELRHQAAVVLEERFADMPEHSHAAEAPPLDSRLETRTFWTELRNHPALRQALWPDPDAGDFRLRFRTRELRRELLSSMARLGHPLIDLYISSVNALGTLSMGAQQAEDVEVDDVHLIDMYLQRLESQRCDDARWTGYRELKAAADHFQLILLTNEPEARNIGLHDASRLFGRLLRAQEPTGGMSGQVNETLVRQFRMPGYPLVLITTELLKEGEDLHTFCANIAHYGLAWMPSSMEQRVGRIDRVSSLTERRLLAATAASPDALLQVYFPHLADSVERIQVNRVLRRQHEFVRLMHEGFGAVTANRSIDLQREVTRGDDPLAVMTGPLRTAYPIRDEMLMGADMPLATDAAAIRRIVERFSALPAQLQARVGNIEWEAAPPEGALLGTVQLNPRIQPFTLLLRSTNGMPAVRCVSPVGAYPDLSANAEGLLKRVAGAGVRMCAVPSTRFESYNLTAEGDVLLSLDGGADGDRVAWLLAAVVNAADDAERWLFDRDHAMSVFRVKLAQEVGVDR